MSTTVKTITVAGVIALIVSLVIGFGFVNRSSPTPPPAVAGSSIGGTTFNTPDNYVNGLSMGGNEIQAAATGYIKTGFATSTWTNTTGRIVDVEYVEMNLVSSTSPLAATAYAVPTSSFRLSAGTTTANAISIPQFSAPWATLIDNVLAATSSSKTTAFNSDLSSGNMQGTVQVLPGQQVFLQVRQDSTGSCTAGVCQQATSTYRGFDVRWYLEYHYQP